MLAPLGAAAAAAARASKEIKPPPQRRRVNPFLDYECFECNAKLALYLARLRHSSAPEAVRLASRLVEGFARAAYSALDDYVELSARIVDHIAATLGDPYAEVRRASMEVARRLLPLAEAFVEGSEDRLWGAVSVAVAGNALDFATGVYSVSLESFSEGFAGKLREPFGIDHTARLRERLEGARTVLYVLDNAGECVLDLPLVRLLSERADVVVAARGGPVFNDATIEEARGAGLGDYAELVTTGCRLPGVSARRCSREFLDLLAGSDLVILKGQGNYQSFYEVERVRRKPTFYLLVPKCRPVARHLGVEVGSKVALERSAG